MTRHMAVAITRRKLIGGLALGAGATAWPRTALATRGYSWPIGVQLWSVDAELNSDVSETLRALSSLGFREVETAGLQGLTPANFRHAIAATGMRAVSAHYSMPDLFDDAPRHIADAKALGVEWIVRVLAARRQAAQGR